MTDPTKIGFKQKFHTYPSFPENTCVPAYWVRMHARTHAHTHTHTHKHTHTHTTEELKMFRISEVNRCFIGNKGSLWRSGLVAEVLHVWWSTLWGG